MSAGSHTRASSSSIRPLAALSDSLTTDARSSIVGFTAGELMFSASAEVGLVMTDSGCTGSCLCTRDMAFVKSRWLIVGDSFISTIASVLDESKISGLALPLLIGTSCLPGGRARTTFFADLFLPLPLLAFLLLATFDLHHDDRVDSILFRWMMKQLSPILCMMMHGRSAYCRIQLYLRRMRSIL
jgi:hypothetical protein